MRKVLFVTCLLLCGCAHESAMPLGNDLMQIDVSAAPIYGRAGAQRIAFEKAATATLDAGYDKFIVLNSGGWNEQTAQGGSYSQYNANVMANQYNGFGSAQGNGGSYYGTMRHPESSMVIRMFHYHEKGSDKAIDARAIVNSKEYTAFGG